MPNNSVKFANRCGLNINIFDYNTGAEGTASVVVDFANECALDISGDITWATGGQHAQKLVGFHNPIEGTFRISTQIMTDALLALITGAKVAEGMSEFVFKNDPNADTLYYIISADTVWKTTEGATKSENILIHKALPKRAYNIVYNGAGDPISVDIEFELLEDGENGEVVTITKT